MEIHYGNIVLAEMQPSYGREIQKLRPAVVVSSNVINRVSPFCVIIPCTSKIQSNNTIHIPFKPNENNKLETLSTLLCEQIKSVDKSRVKKIIGKISQEQMKKIQTGIDFVLNRF